ncbi:MAG: MAPEG family protein [Pseudomonadales bacterium]
MQQTDIFSPVLWTLVLTIIVWLVTLASRLGYFFKQGVDPNGIRTQDRLIAVLPDFAKYPSDNFKNLFEVPVLFYVICAYLFMTQTVDATHITCAWVFCIGRYAHSLVQCTFNNVTVRFLVYLVSTGAVFTMIVRALLAL